jgi:hypothetical protein
MKQKRLGQVLCGCLVPSCRDSSHHFSNIVVAERNNRPPALFRRLSWSSAIVGGSCKSYLPFAYYCVDYSFQIEFVNVSSCGHTRKQAGLSGITVQLLDSKDCAGLPKAGRCAARGLLLHKGGVNSGGWACVTTALQATAVVLYIRRTDVGHAREGPHTRSLVFRLFVPLRTWASPTALIPSRRQYWIFSYLVYTY